MTQTPLTPELICCELASWGIISAQGDDAKSYLQGQLTCNLASLNKDQSTFGAQCDAKGKTMSVFRLFHYQNGYGFFLRASTINTALDCLKKYAVFSKVTFEVADLCCFGIMGDLAEQAIKRLTGKNIDEQTVYAFDLGIVVKVANNRWLAAIEQEKKEQFLQQLSAAEPKLTSLDEAVWQQQEILDAYPHIEAKDQGEHIPQALNLHALDGISFTKGCYTGQETVARAKYRGTNKRCLSILQGDISEEMAQQLTAGNKAGELPSLEIERQVGENWRSAGDFMTYYIGNGKLQGLAVLPNNLEQETCFRLKAHNECLLSLCELPYSLEDE